MESTSRATAEPKPAQSMTTAKQVSPCASSEEAKRAVRDLQRGRGGEHSFRILHDRFYPRVDRFLARWVFSPDERLDLTQDVFLRIYSGLKGYRGEGSLDGWVLRITQNVYRKWRDRQPGGKYASPATVPFEDRRSREESQPRSPLDEVIGREQIEALRRAVSKLPPRMRQAMELRLYQDRPVGEIGTALGISQQTVKVHLFQARKRLGHELQEQFGDIDIPDGEERP